MSRLKLYCFPRITEKLRQKIGIEMTEPFFQYRSNGTWNNLEMDSIEGESPYYKKLLDKEGIWNFDDYGLKFQREYTLRFPGFLFGKYGVVPHDAEIGIALMYTSSESKQRGVIPIGKFNSTMNNVTFDVDYFFKSGMFRVNASFTTILYVATAGNPRQEEAHLANKAGYRLGEIETFTLIFDGKGSWFPIYEKDMKNQPLWNVVYSSTEPAYDSFLDCVEIQINTAHKEYKYIDRKSKTFNRQLLIEVISSAMCVIVENFKAQESEWENAMNNGDCFEGSVSQAINYFIKVLQWDASKPEKLSLSIRKHLEQCL